MQLRVQKPRMHACKHKQLRLWGFEEGLFRGVCWRFSLRVFVIRVCLCMLVLFVRLRCFAVGVVCFLRYCLLLALFIVVAGTSVACSASFVFHKKTVWRQPAKAFLRCNSLKLASLY